MPRSSKKLTKQVFMWIPPERRKKRKTKRVGSENSRNNSRHLQDGICGDT